jgi:hypothetical protein
VLDERPAAVVVGKRTHKVLGLDCFLEGGIKVTPIVRRSLCVDGCRVFETLSWGADFSAWELRVGIREFVWNLRLYRVLIVVEDGGWSEEEDRFESFDIICLKAIVMSDDFIFYQVICSLSFLRTYAMVGQWFKCVVRVFKNEVFVDAQRLNKASIILACSHFTNIETGLRRVSERFLPNLICYERDCFGLSVSSFGGLSRFWNVRRLKRN